MWRLINQVFDCLPLTAIIEEKILCVHAGLSPELQSLEQLRQIKRPTQIPDTGLLCDLVWADPDPDIKGWAESDRGVSFTFGADVVDKFLNRTDLDLVCRAHQVVEDGYEFFVRTIDTIRSSLFSMPVLSWRCTFSRPTIVCACTQGQRRLVTIFSAPNYCGEFDNSAAMMFVGEDLMCSFQVTTTRHNIT